MSLLWATIMKNGGVVRLDDDQRVSEFICKALVCFRLVVEELSKNRCGCYW